MVDQDHHGSVGEQGFDPLQRLSDRGLRPAGALRGALQRGAKALVAERLEQVVHGVDVERPQRVLVVRRHEHDRRHGRRAE